MAIEYQNAPSIGSVELSFDEKGNRTRQIVPEPIWSESGLVPILTNAHMYTESCGATRSIVRAVTPVNFRRDGVDIAECSGWDTEAIIELSGRFEGYDLMYFARNSDTRYSTGMVQVQERYLLENIRRSPIKDHAEVLNKTNKSGFNLEMLDGDVSEADLKRLIEMYTYSFNSYPFKIADSDTIRSMIQDTNIHVCAARSEEDKSLYAVSATELVVLSGSGFRMREMGDSAKMPGVNGLNAPLKIILAAESLKRDGQVDLVFCETRAALGAVNAINYAIGMQYYGTLNKHTIISGPADIDEVGLDGEVNGQYGNMNVWAFSERQLLGIAAELNT